MNASVVVPVYNEDEILYDNTVCLIQYLEQVLDDFELILVENGSSDDTLVYAKLLKTKYARVKLITLPEHNLGEAIKTGVMCSIYEKVVYFPIDLSVNLSFIPESIKLLDHCDIVVGSKKMKLARDLRPINRRLASSGFHRAVQVLFRTNLSDTTCVKAYRRKIAIELMQGVPSCSNVFETEVLLEAQRIGMEINQIPVTVDDSRRGRLSFGYKMATKGQDLVSLRLDVFSIIAGLSLFSVGVLSIFILSVQKLVFNQDGFMNPYSFLISMLMVLFGGQVIAYGLFARLFLQIRKELVLHSLRSGNLFKEEAD